MGILRFRGFIFRLGVQGLGSRVQGKLSRTALFSFGGRPGGRGGGGREGIHSLEIQALATTSGF